MKRLNLLALLLVIATALGAQQLTNSGFESFEADNLNGTGVRPTGWNASNVKRTVLGITASGNLVFEEANGRTGKCVKLQSTEVGAVGITEPAPAWITLGKPWNYLSGTDVSSATAGTDGGISFKYRPDTLAVWIKRTYSIQEDANIVFYSWKGTAQGNGYRTKGGGCAGGEHTDEESDIRINYDANSCGTQAYATQIAEGHWRDNKAYNEWSEIKIPINYLTNDVPEKMNIIFSASNYPNFRSTDVNAGATLYADDVRLIYSSAIHEIVAGKKTFAINETTATCALGKSATFVPELTIKRSGRQLVEGTDYTIKLGGLGEETIITVTAEDGSSTTTYRVTFVGDESHNANLADIKLDGSSITAFNPRKYSYNVELTYGTTSCPEIEAVVSEGGQTVNVKKPASLPGKAEITVTAPDGTTTQTYTVNMTVAQLSDCTLTGIMVNGKTVTGFTPSKKTYRVELPIGTTAAPEVTYTSAYPDGVQTIVLDNKGIDGGATITVTSPAGTSTVYKLTFVVTASTNSQLKMITLDGEPLAGFAPETFVYEVALPLGTTAAPTVAAVKGDEYQTFSIEDGGLDGTTRITVTAQSGVSSIYRITYKIHKSSVSTLKAITLDGEPLDGFSPDVLSYEVKLPVGTDKTPAVSYELGDPFQTVSVVDGGLRGTTRIVVKAQDGSVSTYEIRYIVSQADNSTLLDIKVGGVSIEGFSPETTEYSIVLPRGTETLPEITYTVFDEYQTVRINKGDVNGTTRITVKAQSGATTVYALNFSVETSGNVCLNDIKTGGVSIEGFRPDSLNYSVVLPAGTLQLPEIEYVKADASQMVIVNRGGVNGTTSIVVRAENGTQRVYTIEFSVAKSENAFLTMIYIDGRPLREFDPQRFAYDYTVLQGDQSCPAITVDKAEGQTVTIITPRVTGTARIEVQPESGAKNVYTIDIHYPMSDNAYLADVLVGGFSVEGFRPDSLSYSILLPQNTEKRPAVGYVRADASQTVYKVDGGVNGVTTLDVRAESGAMVRYELTFATARSSAAELDGISLDGKPLAGFAASVYEYNVPFTDVIPEIGYSAQDNQAVSVVVPQGEGSAVITSIADDKSDTARYTIRFTKEVNGNASLSAISLNGENIDMAQFDANDTVYIPRPTAAPAIGYTAVSADTYVAVADAGMRGAELLAVAADGIQRRYVIRYNETKRSVAALDGILIYDNNQWKPVDGFAAGVLEYSHELPWRTLSAPVINAVANDGQTVIVDYGSIGKPTTVTSVSENGADTVVYSIMFTAAKSSVSTLEAIYVDGEALPDFAADKFDYTVTLPAETASAPVLTWDLALADDFSVITEQTVMYHAGNRFEPSTLTVRAEDGSESVYTINYVIEKAEIAPTLAMIKLGALDLEGFAPDKYNYNVKLQYGMPTAPAVKYEKGDARQSVVSHTTGSGLNTVTTISVTTPDNEQPVVYTVSLEPTLTLTELQLTSVAIDGTAFERFTPGQNSYVIDVTNAPVVTYTYNQSENITVEELVNNSKMLQVKLTDKATEESNTYTFSYYYPTDIIPNADFDEWGTAKYSNGAKPIGWTVPSDAVENKKVAAANVNSTECVNNADGAVRLKTIYSRWGIAGSVPGMITLGNMSIELKTFNTSTSSVSGDIQFRNTPNNLKLDYNIINNVSMKNWRVLTKLAYGDKSSTTTYSGSFEDINTWQSVDIPLAYGDLNLVERMNIVINSAHSEDSKGICATGANETWAEMLVDNLRFCYNNLLSEITVDGAPVEGFNPSQFEYNVTLESDYSGVPRIGFTGQVADQEHRLEMTGEVGGKRTATITSVAEDGSQVVYTVNFTRAISTDATLKGIKIDNADIAGFAPETYEYNVEIENLAQSLPDVTLTAGAHQSVTTRFEGHTLVITVTAETGLAKEYRINFVERKDAVTSLANIEAAGHELEFAADQYEYELTLAQDEVQPQISYLKTSDGQTVNTTVDADSAVINVVAQDGTTNASYTVRFVYQNVVKSTLDNIVVDDIPLAGFSSAEKNYTVNIGRDARPSVRFVRTSAAATVKQRITADSILLDVFGSDTTSYAVALNMLLGDKANLTTLTIDGNEPAEFAPANEDYKFECERGEYPAVYARADEHASMGVEFDAEHRRFVYNPTSEDETLKRNVTVSFVNIKNTVTTLAGILIDGSPLALEGDGYTSNAAFAADVYDYELTLKADAPKLSQPAMPVVSAAAGAIGQEIDIEQGNADGYATVTVQSEAGDRQSYSIHFTTEKSAETRLANILVNNRPIDGFDADTHNYAYELAVASSQPTVTYSTIEPFQTVEMETLADSVALHITAENGDEAIYTIKFAVAVSSDAHLAGINIDGLPLKGFDPGLQDYEYELEADAAAVPEVSVQLGADDQQITIVNGGVGETTTIKVVAGDGTEFEYRIKFNRQPSTNAQLAMIYLDGAPLSATADGYTASSDFNASVLNYTITLPVGTETLPMVSWAAADRYQTIDTASANGTLAITVTPEVAELAQRYTIKFVKLLSNNAQLTSLLVDGFEIDGFDRNRYEYTVVLPVGTAVVPQIEGIAADQWQTLATTQAADVNGTATVEVVAEDASFRNTYYVEFSRTKSDVNHLAAILLDGNLLDGFDAGQQTYNVELPAGTAELPEITWETADEWQTVDTMTNGVNGAAYISVKAENGISKTYIIKFSVEKSHNSHLASIAVAGEQLGNFDPEVFDYVVELPYGTTAVPVVTYTLAEHALQHIDYSPAITVSDTTVCTVTADDGVTVSTYRVSFKITPSDNALLDMIFIAGEELDRKADAFEADMPFEPELFEYNIVLPYGTETLPEISWQGQVADYKSIELAAGGVNGTSVITIVSDDEMNVNEYTLNFTVRKSDNAQLKSLQVADGLIDKFESDMLEYTVVFPIGTDTASLPTADDVVFEKMLECQTVSVSQTVPNEIVVMVTAEDGINVNVYVVHFEIELNSNALLSDIRVGGAGIRNFSPTQFEYTYLLLPGATVPDIEGVKSDATQTVDIIVHPVGEESLVYCTAEDGTENVYRILFTSTDINPGERPSMDDVAWTPLGNGDFMASTTRDNVQVMVYLPSGLRVRSEKVALVDPNSNIKDERHDGGTILHFERKGQTYIYVFIYNNHVVNSGKFVY